MTAPLTSRRRYVNSAPQATVPAGCSGSATSFALSTGTGWPATPFPLILDYLQAGLEEVILVTGLSGATVTNCTRGYNGTAAQAHSAGAAAVHGIIALDAEEASQHTSSTGAHGTTSPIVGTTDAQTVTNKDFSSDRMLATSTDPAVKAQVASTGTAPALQVLASDGVAELARINRVGALTLTPSDPAVADLIVKMANLQTANGIELQSNAGSKLWVADKNGRIVHKPSAYPAYKFVPPDSTSATFLQLRDAADSADQFLLLTSGEITSAAKLWLRGFFTDDPLRFPLDGSKFKVDSSGNVSANNLAQVRSTDKGKLQQWGTFTSTFSTESAKSGTLTFPQAFSSPPDIVQGTVQIGASLDVLLNWTGTPTSTGVAWRLFQRALTNISGVATVHWFAIGPA